VTYAMPDSLLGRIANWSKRPTYPYAVCGLVVLLVVPLCAAKERPARVNLFPRLKAGQTFEYQISYHSDKQIKTESNVIVATPADSAKIEVSVLLVLEVLGVQAQGDRAVIHARTKFEVPNSDAPLTLSPTGAPDKQKHNQDANAKFVEFTILADGRLDRLSGPDVLSPEQQQAWQEWASRFLLAAEFRRPVARIAQKWNSVERESSPAPIAGLRWIRESTYVRDEPCGAVHLTVQNSILPSHGEPENCAVILTNATLNQDSSAKNATPDDFKLHELRTAGTARGVNRVITYVSLKTGLVVRATEEASQQMNVIVVKADGSNRVHYDVMATSHSEVVLVEQSALEPRNSP
jgi:hypothetical protein